VERQLDFVIKKPVNVADLFKNGLARHVFSMARLERFRISLKYLIVCAQCRDWIKFFDELPKEVLAELFEIRDSSMNGNVKYVRCNSCGLDANFYDRKKSAFWCLNCKKHDRV